MTRREVVALLVAGARSGHLDPAFLERLHRWAGETTEERSADKRRAHWNRCRDRVGLLLSFQALLAGIGTSMAGLAPNQTWAALRQLREWVSSDEAELLDAMRERGEWPLRLRCGHDAVHLGPGGCSQCRPGAL